MNTQTIIVIFVVFAVWLALTIYSIKIAFRALNEIQDLRDQLKKYTHYNGKEILKIEK